MVGIVTTIPLRRIRSSRLASDTYKVQGKSGLHGSLSQEELLKNETENSRRQVVGFLTDPGSAHGPSEDMEMGSTFLQSRSARTVAYHTIPIKIRTEENQCRLNNKIIKLV